MIALVVIGLGFGLGIYSWNAKSLTGNQMPMPFGLGVGVVMSGSMEPELSVDDLILVKAREEYKVEQVVVFQQNSALVVHKIVKIEGELVTTRGIANDADDDPIPLSAIKGEVVFRMKGVGAVVNWIKSPIGTVCALGVAALFLIWSYAPRKEETDDEIESLKREIEKIKGENKGAETSEDEEV